MIVLSFVGFLGSCAPHVWCLMSCFSSASGRHLNLLWVMEVLCAAGVSSVISGLLQEVEMLTLSIDYTTVSDKYH